MGAIDTTYTFTATDTITSTKMNNIIDQTTFTNDAVFDTTLAVASGKLKVNAQGITPNELAANAVITAKIADSNVTTAKIADLNVTTVKIADDAVTTAKIAASNVTFSKLLLPSNFPIQIVGVTKSNVQEFVSDSSSFVDIAGLSITLTRAVASASGKVLIQGSVNTDTNNAEHGVSIRIQRNGVTIGVGDAAGVRSRATSQGSHGYGYGASPIPISFIDTTPGSDATVTYKLQARTVGTATCYINRDNSDSNDANFSYRTISTLTLTELTP